MLLRSKCVHWPIAEQSERNMDHNDVATIGQFIFGVRKTFAGGHEPRFGLSRAGVEGGGAGSQEEER